MKQLKPLLLVIVAFVLIVAIFLAINIIPRSKNDLYLYVTIHNQSTTKSDVVIGNVINFEIPLYVNYRVSADQWSPIGPIIMPDSVNAASFELNIVNGGFAKTITIEAERDFHFTAFNSEETPLMVVIGEDYNVEFYSIPSGVLVTQP